MLAKAYYEKGNLAQASYHFEKSVANIFQTFVDQSIQYPRTQTSFLVRRQYKSQGKIIKR